MVVYIDFAVADGEAVGYVAYVVFGSRYALGFANWCCFVFYVVINGG